MRGRYEKQKEASTEDSGDEMYAEVITYKEKVKMWRGWMTSYSQQKFICERTIFQK